jgi:hypothetical protein
MYSTDTLISPKIKQIRNTKYIFALCLPASNSNVKATNDVVFFFGETTVLDVRAKIV